MQERRQPPAAEVQGPEPELQLPLFMYGTGPGGHRQKAPVPGGHLSFWAGKTLV